MHKMTITLTAEHWKDGKITASSPLGHAVRAHSDWHEVKVYPTYIEASNPFGETLHDLPTQYAVSDDLRKVIEAFEAGDECPVPLPATFHIEEREWQETEARPMPSHPIYW